MKNLFIHLFTKGIEYYRHTSGTLKEIDTILNTPEDVMLLNLKDAIDQAHRIRVLRENKIGLSHDDIGSSINIPNEKESVLKTLLEPQVEIEQLRKFINEQYKKRND